MCGLITRALGLEAPVEPVRPRTRPVTAGRAPPHPPSHLESPHSIARGGCAIANGHRCPSPPPSAFPRDRSLLRSIPSTNPLPPPFAQKTPQDPRGPSSQRGLDRRLSSFLFPPRGMRMVRRNPFHNSDRFKHSEPLPPGPRRRFPLPQEQLSYVMSRPREVAKRVDTTLPGAPARSCCCVFPFMLHFEKPSGICGGPKLSGDDFFGGIIALLLWYSFPEDQPISQEKSSAVSSDNGSFTTTHAIP